MKISTKGRYALRIMLDLAQQPEGKYVSLKEVANRQQISMKYLELIVAVLGRAGFVSSQRGKSGGYRLARRPDEYTVGAILRLAEGNLAPVSCLECGDAVCERADDCLTLPMWRRLDRLINDYLEGITLAELLEGELPEA